MKKKLFGIIFCSILLLTLMGCTSKQAVNSEKADRQLTESDIEETVSDETTSIIDETGKKEIEENFPMEQPAAGDENLPVEEDSTTKMLDE